MDGKRISRTHILSIIASISIFFIVILLILSLQDSPLRGLEPAENRKSIQYQRPSTPFDFAVWLYLEPPESKESLNKLSISLQKLKYTVDPSVEQSEQLQNSTFCITSVVLFQVALDNQLPINTSMKKLLGDEDGISLSHCGSPSGGTFEFSNSAGQNVFQSFNSPRTFWYPFDNFIFEYYMEIYYVIWIGKDWETNEELELLTSGSKEPSHFTLISTSQIWKYTVESANYSYIHEGYPSNFHFVRIEFKKSILTKLALPTLMLLIFLSILMLNFVENIATLLEAIVAILFGIIGLRQALIPDFIGTQTVWDYIIFSFYILLFVVVLFNILKRNSKTDLAKKPRFIANVATRIVHHEHCFWVDNILIKNVLHFNNLEDALKSGYEICSVCLGERTQNITQVENHSEESDKTEID